MTEIAISPWVIELYGDVLPESLKLRLEDELVIGRADVHSDAQPDVDLSA